MNNYSKDLSWLSAPAFLLIIGLIVFNIVKQNDQSVNSEKNRTGFNLPASHKLP
jgi:hypothetical protein